MKPYSTYAQAWYDRAQIGNTNILVLETWLAPGRNAPPESQYVHPRRLGIYLLKELRAGGYKLPAIFLTTLYLDRPGIEQLAQLDATHVRMPVGSRQLRRHVLNRLGLPW